MSMVLIIDAATLMLRYHYVVDLMVGTVMGMSCVTLGPRVFLPTAADHHGQERARLEWNARSLAHTDAARRHATSLHPQGVL